MYDTYDTKRHLKRLHNDLRSQGLNPVEVLDALSERISDVARCRPCGEGSEADLVAAVYQEILSPNARNGLGQYLTPLVVADMMANVVCADDAPRSVLDPFCGIGLLLDRVGLAAPEARLLGIEINEPVASMATALSELGASRLRVRRADAFALFTSDQIEPADVVVANPPFGAIVANINHNHPRIPTPLQALKNIPAELLGLEVCINALTEGGRLAIVLPQSILTNRRWNEYRRDFMTRLRIDAAVSLPEETFGPFKGVAKACVLFGTRETECEVRDFPLHTSMSVGYSFSGRSTDDSDLNAITDDVITKSGVNRHVIVGTNGDAHVESEHSVGDGGIRLGDIAEVFTGRNPSRHHYSQDGPWLLKVGDLAGSAIAWRGRPKNRVDKDWFHRQERIHLAIGDVCMTAAGHRPKYIGLKVDLVDEIPPEGALPSGEVMLIRLRQDSSFEPEALLLFFRSAQGYGLIQELVRGSTGHLYSKDLANLRIPDLDGMFGESTIEAYREAIRHFREFRRLESLALSEAGISEQVGL